MTFFSFPHLPDAILHRRNLFILFKRLSIISLKNIFIAAPIKMKYVEVNHRVLIACD